MFSKTILSIFTLVLSCQNMVSTVKSDPNIPYALNEPNQTFLMPSILQEISGISFSKDKKTIISLQDEAGILFFINKNDGKVEKQIIFKPEGGDFEDLAIVENTAYVLRSKGVISAIENYTDEKNFKVINFDQSPFTKSADTEGLTFDKKNNRLLIACKGATNDANSRAIWSFDLQTKQYSQSPVFEISLKNIQDYLTEQKADKEEFKKFFDISETTFNFGPSAIGIHPKTGDYYILSSIGKTLLVTNPQGKIKGITKLQKKIHTQPEGIEFDEDGTLYISNEGKKEDIPTIYRFQSK